MYNILFIQEDVFTIFSDLFCFNILESTTWFSLVILLNFFFFRNKCHLSGHDVILCNDVSRINFNRLKNLFHQNRVLSSLSVSGKFNELAGCVMVKPPASVR